MVIDNLYFKYWVIIDQNKWIFVCEAVIGWKKYSQYHSDPRDTLQTWLLACLLWPRLAPPHPGKYFITTVSELFVCQSENYLVECGWEIFVNVIISCVSTAQHCWQHTTSSNLLYDPLTKDTATEDRIFKFYLLPPFHFLSSPLIINIEECFTRCLGLSVHLLIIKLVSNNPMGLWIHAWTENTYWRKSA